MVIPLNVPEMLSADDNAAAAASEVEEDEVEEAGLMGLMGTVAGGEELTWGPCMARIRSSRPMPRDCVGVSVCACVYYRYIELFYLSRQFIFPSYKHERILTNTHTLRKCSSPDTLLATRSIVAALAFFSEADAVVE